LEFTDLQSSLSWQMVMAMHGGNRLSLIKSINMKYGSARGGWCLDVGKVPHGVSLWKRIHHG